MANFKPTLVYFNKLYYLCNMIFRFGQDFNEDLLVAYIKVGLLQKILFILDLVFGEYWSGKDIFLSQ